LRQAYHSYATPGKGLSLESFEEALRVCEDVNWRRVRGTPLASRLFALLDGQSGEPGFVTEDAFAQGMEVLLRGNPAAKIDLTFKVYAQGGDAVQRESLLGLFEESWALAWEFLAEKAENGPVPVTEITDFGKAQRGKLREKVAKSVDEFDPERTGALTAVQFAKWARLDRSIKVECGRDVVEVATSVLHIERTESAYPSLAPPPMIPAR
jgi:hypothetical protein